MSQNLPQICAQCLGQDAVGHADRRQSPLVSASQKIAEFLSDAAKPAAGCREGSGDTIRARAYRAKDGRSGQAACCFDTDVVPGAWHCGFSRRFHLHVEGEAAVVAQSVIDVRPGRADVIFAALSFGCPGSCARLPLRPDNNCPFHCERAPKVHFPWRSPKITATSPRLLSARCPAADLTTPARTPLGRTQARRNHSVEAREQASTH